MKFVLSEKIDIPVLIDELGLHLRAWQRAEIFQSHYQGCELKVQRIKMIKIQKEPFNFFKIEKYDVFTISGLTFSPSYFSFSNSPSDSQVEPLRFLKLK